VEWSVQKLNLINSTYELPNTKCD